MIFFELFYRSVPYFNYLKFKCFFFFFYYCTNFILTHVYACSASKPKGGAVAAYVLLHNDAFTFEVLVHPVLESVKICNVYFCLFFFFLSCFELLDEIS